MAPHIERASSNRFMVQEIFRPVSQVYIRMMTPHTTVQGGHGLAVKTMFRFNPSSSNKDECCGRVWLPRTLEVSRGEVGKPRLRSGGQA
jgi:hypothetical protein